jgi:nucleoside-diphosphate-sugar epimerase
MSRTIALTGATGFIGSNLARRLAKAGWQIKALVRPTSSRTRLAKISIQWIEGKLNDLDSLQRLVYKTDAVIHCAGAVRGVSEAQFHRVNVDGVARLVQAALKQHPTPRFLLLSSLAAREPRLSPYAASKHQGEEALAARGGEMFWAAFRPPAVYGPGDRELLPLFRLIQMGIAPVLGPENARFSMLYVDDLAEAVVLWLERGRQRAGIFELHDGRLNGYTWNAVIEIAARQRTRRVMRAPVPLSMLNLLAMMNLAAARIFGYRPMLTPGKVRELRHPNWVCDNSALSREIGWAPQIGLEEGLQRTLGAC